MPIDFPSSPTTGQVYTYQGKSWVYNGTGWDAPKALSEIGAVRTFADATARTAAIPSPTEGIVTYLNDTNALEVFNNGWNTLNPSTGNAIINGAFDIWQRGTGTAPTATSGYFSADRWITLFTTATPTSSLASQQTFSPGAAPIEGYEGTFFLRHTLTTVGSNTICSVGQRIEDVRTLAGQTVTLSFFAKADSNRTHSFRLDQNFGSGGSSQVVAKNTTTFDATTSWQRFSFTFDLPSISDKTIGTNSYLQVRLSNELSAGSVFDIWGVQLEAGTVATPFRRNAPSIQAELAACQRYYQRIGFGSAGDQFAVGFADSTTSVRFFIPLTTTMRSTPSVTFSGGTDFSVRYSGGGNTTTTSISSSGAQNSPYAIQAQPNVASGLTAGEGCILYTANTGAYIEAASEL